MNDNRTAALAAICDTFITAIDRSDDPTGYWARSAGQLHVAERIQSLLAQIKAEDRAQFNQLIDLLASPLLGLTWLGPFKPAHRLTPEQRATLLRRWAASPLPLLRNGFNTLRKATGLLYYGDIPAGQSENPNWAALEYRRPDAYIQPDPTPLSILPTPSPGQVLDCDVLVVGSGSGGGVIAARLAAAGHDVLVVEKSGYTPRGDYNQREFPMLNRHFEAGALLATQNGSVSILAGSTLGGGSAINWAGMLRTPEIVLDEWASVHQNPQFRSVEFQHAMEAIEQRTHVHTDIQHNPHNQALLDSAKRLGWEAGIIPMNMRIPDHLPPDVAWKAMGFSCIGDAYGIKQSVPETFLRDAQRDGARLLTRVQIQKILIERGHTTGASGQVLLPDGQRYDITIRAKKVVVSSGSLHTPVLLIKSGLTHPQIGRNLHLHPVMPVAGIYQNDMNPWYGPMMSVVVKSFANLDKGWGYRIECPPVHPGLAASTLSWESAEQYKSDMLNLRKMGVFFSLVRDRYSGKVTVGPKSGEPVLHYNLHEYDKKHLIEGVQRCAEAHEAAGAERITVQHNQPLHYFRNQSSLSFDAFRQSIAARSWGLNRMGVFSAHQMGTCRMGGTKDYPVKPSGETREVRGLYVGDASLFPSASGVNPMLTVKATAYLVANLE